MPGRGGPAGRPGRRLGMIVGVAAAGLLLWSMLCCTGLTALGAIVGPTTTTAASAGSTPSPSASSSPRSARPSPSITPTGSPKPVSAVRPTTAAQTATAALAALTRLPVHRLASSDGYSASQFGRRWADTDNNHCDSRNDTLRRDLTHLTVKAGGCHVLTGSLRDPYTGHVLTFHATAAKPAVSVDRIVSLSDAWRTGAAQLTPTQREQLANDPANLLAVGRDGAGRKHDADAVRWLPSNAGFRCVYVIDQIAVKARYRLWVTGSERDAMVRTLTGCGAVSPSPSPSPTHRAAASPPPAPTAAPTTPAAPPPPLPANTPPPADTPPADAPVYGVHPGAFCSPDGAYGYTDRGTLMQCTTKPSDPYDRWRAAT
jgi:hypothetical protein